MMRKNLCLLLFLCAAVFASCAHSERNLNSSDEIELNRANHSALGVSIIQLIAHPAEYHGKKVRVIGVGNLEFEGNGVYNSREDWKYAVYKNGLWIELGDQATPYLFAKAYNGKYVIIEGTFDQNSTGHLDMWSGAIIDITRYELWE